ncbi:MAG: CARDB domain-containing protein, partial [Candidatus Nanohaloarchaea archaeon]
DGDKSEVLACDWNSFGNSCGDPTFTEGENGYHHLDLNLSSASISPGSYGEVQFRIHDSDWDTYTQSDDWSYINNDAYEQTRNITIYYEGKLVWGTEPDGDKPQKQGTVLGANLGTLVNGSSDGEVMLGFSQESSQEAAPSTTCSVAVDGPVRKIVSCENSIVEANYTFQYGNGLVNQSIHIKSSGYNSYYSKTFFRPGGDAGDTGDEALSWSVRRGSDYPELTNINYSNTGELFYDSPIDTGYSGSWENTSDYIFGTFWDAGDASKLRGRTPSLYGREIGFNGSRGFISANTTNFLFEVSHESNPDTSDVTDAGVRALNPVKIYEGSVGQFTNDYLTDGTYMQTYDAGREVFWNKSVIDANVPSGTSYDVIYGENSSGTWEYWSSISALDKSRYLRFEFTLSGDGTDTPRINRANITYKYVKEAWLEVKSDSSVQGDRNNSIIENFQDYDLPKDIKWNVRVTDSNGDYTSDINNRTLRVMPPPDFNTTEIYMNVSDPAENQEVKFTAEVENDVVTDASSVNVSIKLERWNGTEWVVNKSRNTFTDFPGNTARNITLNWTAEIGSYRIKAFPDPENETKELNRGDNLRTEKFNVSAYNIFYGDAEKQIKLQNRDKAEIEA